VDLADRRLMESTDVISVSRRPRAHGRPVDTGRRRRPVARVSAGQRVCRKYRRRARRVDVVGRLQQRELDKLRRIVPALCSASQTRPARRVSKVNNRNALSQQQKQQRAALCRLVHRLYITIYVKKHQFIHLLMATCNE